MASQFGQLMTLFNIINQTAYTAAESAISAFKMRGEAKTAEQQAETQARIAQMSAAEKQKLYAQELALSQAHDALVKKIAIIGGISFGIIIILIYFGISYIKKKRDEKYEYVIETV